MDKKEIKNKEIKNDIKKIENKQDKIVEIDLDSIKDTGIKYPEMIEKERYDELENKYKYLLADFDNVKKRYNNTLNNISNYKEEYIAKDLLEVIDNLERDETDNEFINLIKKQLYNILSNYGIKPIYSDKQRSVYFNNEYDEAIASVKTDEENLDNTIANVVKKGYFYKDKVIRYEQVIVNKFE